MAQVYEQSSTVGLVFQHVSFAPNLHLQQMILLSVPSTSPVTTLAGSKSAFSTVKSSVKSSVSRLRRIFNSLQKAKSDCVRTELRGCKLCSKWELHTVFQVKIAHSSV